MNKSILCFWIIANFTLVSCEIEKEHISINDNFDELSPLWVKDEIKDASRYEITNDPTDANNNVLKFQLFPDDFNAGGKRNEFKLKTKDSIGMIVNYSFQFMLTEDFFKKDRPHDWIIIHQWHDDPPKGKTWAEYGMLTKPPVHLYIQGNTDGNHKIVYTYGLWNRNMKLTRSFIFKEPIQPNKWYTFSNEVLWDVKETAYSIPRINDEFLVETSENNEHKVFGANMYNVVPNYYKMGLYGNNLSKDTLSIYFDNFTYSLKKAECSCD